MHQNILIGIYLAIWFIFPQVITANTLKYSTANVLEIASGIYVRASNNGIIFQDDNIANIGFVIGDRCVAVIDSGGSLEEGIALQRAIKQRTRLPVCYVVNTHVHPDHILGNFAFKTAHTKFIGHEKLPRAMQLLGPTYLERSSVSRAKPLPAEYIVLPDQTIKSSLRLDLGGRELLIQAHPQAHTDNDLTVYDDKTQTWWLSDLLFVEHIPVIGGSGSLKGWLNLMRSLQRQPAIRVVPGHGPVSDNWPTVAEAEVEYLEMIRDETRQWLAQDGELPEALNTIGNSHKARWHEFEQYHKRNITNAYTELEWE